MARVPGNPTAASLGQKTMTRTIQCPECGVVLNVPDAAAGRKLRCPKCATKFAAPSGGDPGDSVIADSSPESTLFPTRKGQDSQGSTDLPTRRPSSGSIDLPTSGSRGSSGDIDLPSSPGSLRDTFDLPMLSEDLPRSAPSKAKDAAPADALALFQDEPKQNRKPKGAEARAKARRCPSCGGVVSIGMSLCNTCGLDLDTGQRVVPLEVFEDEMPVAARSEIASMGVLFIGSLCAVANLLLSLVSVVAWAKGQGLGVLCLLIVWVFGIYSSVQFLRRKSIRPLFLALGLGVGIGVVYLIAIPIYEVNAGTDVVITNPEVPTPPFDPTDPNAPPVRNIADQLDMNRITWGIAVLLTYAALSVYLNSPSIKREFKR